MERKERVYGVYEKLFFEETRRLLAYNTGWGNIGNKEEILDSLYGIADLMVTRFEVCSAKPKEE